LTRNIWHVVWAPFGVVLTHATLFTTIGHRPALDPVFHFLGGVAGAWSLLQLFRRFPSVVPAATLRRPLLTIIGGVSVAAVAWELLEFAADQLLGTTIQRGSLDTNSDLILGIAGAVVMGWLGTRARDSRGLDRLFERAVAAIDTGDVSTLEGLLAKHPELVRERLTSPGEWLRSQICPALDGFFKHPYLLWFVTEDAVRTGRLPANVAAIARAIVQAARRTGVKDLQHQLDSTLHFALCSPIGRDDGRQLELIDVLIEEGASTEGGPVQALICYNAAAARRLLERGATLTLPAALCLERWDDVARLAGEASANDKQVALGLAALNGKAEALARLIPLGVDLDAFTSGFYSHATPLHHAVWSGSLAAVKVLVEAGASLTTRDKAEDGTPLGWAEYAASGKDASTNRKQYAEIAAYLREKGAPA
jgi:hypothetical protein